MSTTASKQNKRTAVYLELKTARQHIKNASEELAGCSKILSELMAGQTRIVNASQLSQATHISDKPKRDAIPTSMRKRISNLLGRLEEIIEDVRAIPVTQDEKSIAKLSKLKANKKKER